MAPRPRRYNGHMAQSTYADIQAMGPIGAGVAREAAWLVMDGRRNSLATERGAEWFRRAPLPRVVTLAQRALHRDKLRGPAPGWWPLRVPPCGCSE